jgi:hypothetical protein
MRGVLEDQLLLQAPARLKETIGPVVGDRASLALALGVQRTTAPAHPRPAAPRARDEPPRIEVDGDLIAGVLGRLGGLPALALQGLLGLARRPAPPLARAQVPGQLVAALAPARLVLAAVGLRRLGQDLAGDLAEVAVGVDRRVGRHPRAVDRHHPDRHKPRPRAHSPSTPQNTSPNARSWRQRNSAIVE